MRRGGFLIFTRKSSLSYDSRGYSSPPVRTTKSGWLVTNAGNCSPPAGEANRCTPAAIEPTSMASASGGTKLLSPPVIFKSY